MVFNFKDTKKYILGKMLQIKNELQSKDTFVYSIMQGAAPIHTAMNTGMITNIPQHLKIAYLGRKRFQKDLMTFYDTKNATQDIQQTTIRETNLLEFLQQRMHISKQFGQINHAFNNGVDMVCIDQFLSGHIGIHGFMLAPYINASLEVKANMAEQLTLVHSKSHRRKIQAAIKAGCAWRKTQSIEDFNMFYDTMYKPFIHERFEYDGFLVERDYMAHMYRKKGFLLILEQDNKPISGAFLYISQQAPKTLIYWKYGLANATLLTANVFGEINAMTEAMVLQYAIDNQFTTIDFGLTKPYPNNGIFAHKKRVGCDFTKIPGTPEFELLINPTSMVRILNTHPMILFHHGQKYAWLGHQGELSRLQLNYLQDKIRACGFLSLRGIDLFVENIGASRDALEKAVAEVQQDMRMPIAVKFIGATIKQ